MVSRITAADDTKISWLTHESLLDEPGLLPVHFPRPKRRAKGSWFRVVEPKRPELDDLGAATRVGSAIAGRSDSALRVDGYGHRSDLA